MEQRRFIFIENWKPIHHFFFGFSAFSFKEKFFSDGFYTAATLSNSELRNISFEYISPNGWFSIDISYANTGT